MKCMRPVFLSPNAKSTLNVVLFIYRCIYNAYSVLGDSDRDVTPPDLAPLTPVQCHHVYMHTCWYKHLQTYGYAHTSVHILQGRLPRNAWGSLTDLGMNTWTRGESDDAPYTERMGREAACRGRRGGPGPDVPLRQQWPEEGHLLSA